MSSRPGTLVRSSSSAPNLPVAPWQQQQQPPQQKTASPSAASTSLQPRTHATPAASTPPPNKASPARMSTPGGSWQHPRMQEILARQNRTNFDRSNVYALVWSSGIFMASFIAPTYLHLLIPTSITRQLSPYPAYALLLLRLLILLNIAISLLPLYRKPDPCYDIPLTPSQRHLLGLPPMSRPATLQEVEAYVTPPRYPRTPASPSTSLRGEISTSSPLSGSRITPTNWGTPTYQPAGSLSGTPSFVHGSPSSPYGGRQRTVSASGARQDSLRRSSSFTRRHSPLGFSDFDASMSLNTPSKKLGTRASLGLNNKWLYDKGKAPAHTAAVEAESWGWGSGSVFM